MEFVIGAIGLISLAFNYLIYKKVTATYPVGTLEETDLEPIVYCCSCHREDTVKIPPSEPEPIPKVQVDYGAWRNEKEIPWIAPSKPQAPIKPIEKGPLARPDGFV